MLARITPGSSIGMHTHETNSEIVYVLSGTARIMMDDGERLSMPDRRTIARRDIGMRPTVRGMRIWWFTPLSRSMGRANKKAASPTKMGKAAKPGSPKRGQGTMSLAGCRDSVPAGVWGNAPTVPRATSMSNVSNKRCRQRSVPAPNFARPQTRPQAALPQNFVKNHKKAA